MGHQRNIVNVIILGLLMAKDGGGGNIAREMAAAPLPRKDDKPEPGNANTPKLPTLNPENRFNGIFGAVIFKAAPATAAVYGADREGDRLTKKLASVEIELRDSRLFAKGKVQAVQPKTGEAPAYPEFLFQASQFGGQCLHTDDPNCAADFAEYREYVLDLFDTWSTTGASNAGPVVVKKQRAIAGLSLK